MDACELRGESLSAACGDDIHADKLDVDTGGATAESDTPGVQHILLDNRLLRQEVMQLKKRLATLEMTQDSFRSNDVRVSFYTGLPSYSILEEVFELLEDVVPHSENSKLTGFQEFIAFLLKVHLNVPFQDIAERFGVSRSTVSRNFHKWLQHLYSALQCFIKWPSRNTLSATMPMAFRENFGCKIVVILDCFEIFIERPSSLDTRAATWSNYRSHNTVKYLVGIAPQGCITYVSQGHGGRASDKHITESCGVLDYLHPGGCPCRSRVHHK